MTKTISNNLLESMAAIFNLSYSGAMVGKPKGVYLEWSELSDQEKNLISKEQYDNIVNVYATNTNKTRFPMKWKGIKFFQFGKCWIQLK
jgi:hypothetical protein